MNKADAQGRGQAAELTPELAPFSLNWEKDGGVDLKFGGESKRIRKGESSGIKWEGKEIGLEQKASGELSLTALEGVLVFELKLGCGFVLRCPKGTTVVFNRFESEGLSSEERPLDIAVLQGGPVSVQMRDGARLLVPAGSLLRVDSFNNCGYVLTARGSVELTTPEGTQNILSEKTMPHSGGPLVRNANGGIERTVPTLRSTLEFEEGGEVTWKMEGQSKKLSSEAANLHTANGTLVALRRVESYGVELEVRKGDLRVSIEGLGGWSAVVLTGQKALIRFDPSSRVVDFIGQGSTEPSRLLLAGRHLVVSTGGSLLQFQGTNPLKPQDFLVSATGGNSLLVDLATGSETQLGAENRVLRAVLPKAALSADGAPAVDPRGMAVVVGWQGDGVTLDGAMGTAKTKPGAETILKGSGGEELKVTQIATTEVVLEAVVGSFRIQPKPAAGLSIELPQGNSVTLTNPKVGTVVVRSGDGNTGDLGLAFSDATLGLPPLKPGGAFTFVSGVGGQDFGVLGGATVFSEPAGAGADSGAASAPGRLPFATGPLNQQTALDVTRLPQAQASGVGN